MKKQSPLKTKQVEPLLDTDPFGKTFVIEKNNVLSPLAELPESAEPIVKPFRTEAEFEKLIFGNRAALFGEKTIGIRIATAKELPFQHANILFDFSDSDAPRYYFLCVILGKGNDFFIDFFPFMTDVFSALRDVIQMSKLILMVSDTIKKNKPFLKQVATCFVTKSVEDAIASTLLTTPRCVLVTGDTLTQLQKARKAYTETWQGMLDVMYVRKYLVRKQKIISLHPTLAELQLKEQPQAKPTKMKVKHTEADHLAKGLPLTQSLYNKLKAEALKIDSNLIFNADGAHYISLKPAAGKNLAFFHLRRNSIYLVVKLAEKAVRKIVKKAEVKTLPPKVQKFWNGDSTGLVITEESQLKEIVAVFKQLLR